MAGRINDDDVKAVRAAVPIDAVVSEYLQLRNAGGGNLKGLCPFHDEKSPSFQVSPSKGLYYCFGCQEGGDTVDFIMKIDHLSFAETIERLASQSGITLRYEEGGYTPGRQQGERTRLVEAHKAAAQFYVEQLDRPEAEIGRKFLAERGFDQAAAQHFGVGYSPAGWDHLVRFLRGRGFTDQELILSGLAQESRRNPIDRFRGRLMWPIRDISGEVVGFGARKLREDDNGPKYLNTPETPLYKKSQVLYGIDLAKRDIAKSSRAVVVEGYTDVMACHLAGVTTAIATCGTSFGGDHIKILRRLLMDNSGAEVIFTFDGDAAGQKAALRAFEDDQKFAAETYIAITPGGMDPCELRLAEGDDAVKSLVESRTQLFEFAIRQIIARHNLDTAVGRAAALEEAAPVVAGIKNSSIQHESAVHLAGLLGILDTQFVVRRVSQLARWARERGRGAGGDQRGRGDQRGGPGGDGPRQRHRGGPEAQGAPVPPRGPALNLRSPAHRVERELLKLALQHPHLVSPAFDAYGIDEFTAPPYAAVRRAIEDAGGAAAADDDYLARVREVAPDDTVRAMVTELAVEPPHTRRDPDEVYAGVQLVAVRLAAVNHRVTEVRGALQRLGQHADPAHLAAVQNELWVLQQYGQSLRDRGAAAL
ncbi:DNA primase [Streptomyces iranensis]|uniref:DNA primase n=1 Tax=Streptomyces iranensis TaxID=576784 RepID=A0A061A2C5_9ACTN|nr:DNA primase [Streptomyces iranensis]MBP2064977.1 DNA primase [Streptomyces iranensis]CDR10078.1 DNA primase [Streptomyces iranensis]